MTNELTNRILSIIRFCKVLLVDDSAANQLLSLTSFAGEKREKVRRVQEFGLTSNPPPDSTGLVLRIGGNTNSMVAICVGNTTARVVGLDSGDVAVYDNHGNKIVLSNQGVTITASKVTVVNSDVIVNGGDVIADGISLKSHTHNESIGTITGVAQ